MEAYGYPTHLFISIAGLCGLFRLSVATGSCNGCLTDGQTPQPRGQALLVWSFANCLLCTDRICH